MARHFASLFALAAVAWTPASGATALLVHDSRDPYATIAYLQARTTFDEAHVAYDTHDLRDDLLLPALQDYRAVVTTVENFSAIAMPSVSRLWQYVERGGGLVVAYRGFSPHLGGLFGFDSSDWPAFEPDGLDAFRVTASLMPGADSLHIDNVAVSPYAADHADDCTTLATRRNGRPAGWTCPRGEGRVVYWNTALLASRRFRGFLLQSLALVDLSHVRPIANSAVVYLDDFPSPATDAFLEPIASERGQGVIDFYLQTWWPDMQALADSFDIAYTSVVTFSYNGRRTPPFDLDEWTSGTTSDTAGRTLYYSPTVARLAGEATEAAFHGYNHQSLQLGPWADQATMEEALRAARAQWEAEGFAPMPRTYVPPMNWIDSTGTAALLSVFPEIETIASLYTGPFAEGQGREYGPEPWAPGVYALPRNTSGYLMTEAQRLLVLNGLQFAGIWGHFVHPDEVFANADRDEGFLATGLRRASEYGWRPPSEDGFYHGFQEWLAFVREQYPWIDSVPASEAARRMQGVDAVEIDVAEEQADGRRTLRMTTSDPEVLVYLAAHPDERVEAIDGGEVLHRWDGPLLSQLVVQPEAPTVSVRFLPASDSTETAPADSTVLAPDLVQIH